jgi:glyceraldehyde-3-phosphate dehydrogenase/erythrose-4-phosphate dehydrogenase
MARAKINGGWRLNGNIIKLVSRYDNEWGYSCHTVDLVQKVGKSQ